MAIYVPLFRIGSIEALLKFVTLPHKIIRVQYLSAVSQSFGMTRNLVVGEALQVYEQKAWETGTEKNAKYGLVMKDLVYHSFPPKVLQRQKRYLRRGLYKPCDTKILDFICHIYEMVN